MRPRLLLPLLALPWFAGCAPDAGDPGNSLGQARSPIINGTQDKTRQAVIALLRLDTQGNIIGECSGTIVAVDQATSTGYVLTAAHCVQPEAKGDPATLPSEYVVAQGNDFIVKSTTYYPVQDYRIHPSYALFVVGSPYDFAMVKFGGASPAKTPIIPPLPSAEDSLAPASPITAVGYGVTVAEMNQTNTVRFSIDKALSSATTFKLGMNETGGGICFGDSGGPWLTLVGGVEKVGGVSSYVEGQCSGNAYAGRVSLVTDDFVLPYINEQTGNQTCNECQSSVLSGAGACADSYKTCQDDTDCAALLQCLGPCGDQACTTACRDAHPSGQPVYDKIGACICDSGCPKACAAECAGPACGFSSDGACGACIQTSCCAEGAACVGDATCAACNSATPPGNCSSNPAQNELSFCLASQCNAACVGSKCGLTADATCQGCFEASCCAETTACTQDKICFLCTTGQLTGADCAESAAVKTFYQCLGQSCATPCNVPEVGGTGGMGGAGGAGGSGEGGAGGDGGTGGASEAGQGGTAGAAQAGQGGTAAAGAGTAGQGPAGAAAGQAGTGPAGAAGQAGAGQAGAGPAGSGGVAQGGAAGTAAGKGGAAGSAAIGGAAGAGKAGAAGTAGQSAAGNAGAATAGSAGVAGSKAGGAGGSTAAGASGAPSDAVTEPAGSSDGGGCGCRAGGAAPPASAGWMLGVLGLAGLRWRRRSRR